MTNLEARGLVSAQIMCVMADYYQQDKTVLAKWQGNKLPQCIEHILNKELPKPPAYSTLPMGHPADCERDNGYEGYHNDSSDDDDADVADFYW